MYINIKSVFFRSLSALLALLSVIGLLASLSMLPVLADDGESSSESTDEKETGEISFSDRYEEYYINGKNYLGDKKEDGYEDVDFSTEEKRLAAMELYTSSGDFQLYVDKITGEVAVKDVSTGDVIFTNPYDVSSSTYYEGTKKELMSQVLIRYTDNGNEKTYYSFKDSALLGQISVKRLRGGVRVEYSIGQEESRTLLPRLIEKSRFEESILSVMEAALDGGKLNRKYSRFIGFYTLFDPNGIGQTDETRKTMYEKFEVTKDGMAVYALDEDIKLREVKLLESYIKECCPEYTYEQLDKDHSEVKYTATNKAPANFRLALEYYLNESGVEVRLPANGLRFDESSFQLTSISVLMYMGAGDNAYNGYNMIPDGSGSLIRYEDVSNGLTITGTIYGQDYAYQEIGNANQEIYRMPVFGSVTSNVLQTGKTLQEGKQSKRYANGYVAIITEGEALTQISSTHGGDVTHNYNSCYCTFTPRPKDSYNLAEAISIGSNTTYTVVSDRKYTGSYRIQYIMLTDPDNTENRTSGRTYYDTSYVGMAKAYRNYLISKGTLLQLTGEDVGDGIPLYIENFGAIETDETVLSFPVTVKKALTSFDDIKTMAEEMKASGIKNINFRLTGFTNGGMASTVPTKVKFEKAVGGNKGYTELLKYAAENGIGVYPDFDFVYMSETGAFDGFSYKRDAVKSIDNRYITKRSYDAILQTFTTTGKICISSSVFRSYFNKFQKSFDKVLGENKSGVSVGTLGSDLNTDFDEDDPYNREDSKKFTVEMLSQLKGKYGSIMIDGGNAYAVPYADVILNVSLDSSRFLNASESIPFFGMVYHGFVEFAGEPTNMAGDIKYEVLKIIENGATLYLMLSYDNVELLKEDPDLSQYYAISYEFWAKTFMTQRDENGNVTSVGLYDQLSEALNDVQTSLIDDHRFLTADRVLSDDELKDIERDATAAFNSKKAEFQSAIDANRAALNDFNAMLAKYGEGTEMYNKYCSVHGLAGNSASIIKAFEDVIVANEQKIAELKYGDYENDAKSKINTVVDDGSVVYVRYDNGHWFILNYNSFDIKVASPVDGEIISIAAMSYHDSQKANN